MADPLYIWLGRSFADCNIAESASGTLIQAQPHHPWAEDDRHYDFAARIEGVDGRRRFPLAPLNDSYAPLVWNHDDAWIGTNSIVSITAADPAVATTAFAHGRTAGDTLEIRIEGVTGADADEINGTWTATATSTNAWTIADLDATGLSFSVATATVRQPAWSYYTAQATVGGKPITCDTDPSIGGQSTIDPTANLQWGAELSMLADLHDRWGESGKRPYFMSVGIDAGLIARESVPVTAVEPDTVTILSVSASSMLADRQRPQRVTLWGFSGDYAALNGEHDARWLSSTSLSVSVDTSGASSYTGGGRIAMRPRWHPDVGGEAFADFQARLADAMAAADGLGLSLECRGIVLGMGTREMSSGADDDAEPRTGLRIQSVSATGFPTTVTLSTSHGLHVEESAHLPTVRIRNCGDLDGLHEARIVDEDTLIVHATNSESIDTASAEIDIGDPSWFFAEELSGFVARVRSSVATETGDTASDIPVVLAQPVAVSGCGAPWDGTAPHATCAAARRVETAIDAVHAPRSGVSVVQTAGLRTGAGESLAASRAAVLEIGHDVAAELVRQESRSTAYGISTGRGAPVYVVVGGTITAGTASYLSAYYDSDQRYDGSQWFGRGINILDHRNGRFAEFTGVDRSTGTAQPGNANTHPTWNLNPGNIEGGSASLVGPEQSLLLHLRDRHGDPIYVVKLGVAGAALTDSARLIGVTGTRVVESDDDSVSVDLTTNIPHGRYDYTSTVQVAVSGLSSVGIPNGTYNATPQSPTVLRITPGSSPSGGIPFGGGAVRVPRPDWRRASEDIWPSMTSARDTAFAQIRAAGLEPDVRAVFVPDLGVDDALYGVTSQYQASLSQWFQDLRDAWTTRSQPAPALPIVMGRVRSSDEYPGGASTSVYIEAVQLAQSTVCAADAAAVLVDSDTCAFNSDDYSLAWAGYVRLGELLSAALDDVDQSCSAVEGSHISTIPDSTFVS